MQKQSQLKYNRLIKASEALFIQWGYRAVSLDQIAEAAGISKMTIYKHFPSKEELFMEVMILLNERLFKEIKEALSSVAGAMEKINWIMNYSHEESKKYSLALYKDIMSIPYIMERMMREKTRLLSGLFAEIIQAGIETEEIRPCNVEWTTNILLAFIETFGYKYMNKAESMDEIRKMTAYIYDFLKYGLVGRPGVF